MMTPLCQSVLLLLLDRSNHFQKHTLRGPQFALLVKENVNGEKCEESASTNCYYLPFLMMYVCMCKFQSVAMQQNESFVNITNKVTDKYTS